MPSEKKLFSVLREKGHILSNESITSSLVVRLLHRKLHGTPISPEEDQFIEDHPPTRRIINYLRQTHHQNALHPLRDD